MGARLDGRVAIITGAASGIGRATAVRFAEEGADIVVADVLAGEGNETAKAIEALGRRTLDVPTDVAKEADCEALAEAAIREFGRIDILFAAAGILHGGYVSGRDPDSDNPFVNPVGAYVVNDQLENWEKVLAVNLTGVMLTDRAVARRMISADRGGSIINVASVSAKKPDAALAAYCASKAGVWMLTKVLALELAPHQIRVNAVAPGTTETPMTAPLHATERRKTVEQITPLGRLGRPVDVANTALFLASDESEYYTGQMLQPDGGWYM